MNETIQQFRLSTYRKYKPEFFLADYIKDHIAKARMFVVVSNNEDGDSVGVPLDRVVGQVIGISEDEHGVNVSFVFLNTPMTQVMQGMSLDDFKVTPAGIGTINADGSVGDDYRLSYFSLCLKQGDENDEEQSDHTSGLHASEGLQGTPEEEPQSSPQAALTYASEGEGTPDR